MFIRLYTASRFQRNTTQNVHDVITWASSLSIQHANALHITIS